MVAPLILFKGCSPY